MSRPQNAAAAAQAPPEQPSTFKQFFGFAQKALVIYFATQFVGQLFSSNAPSQPSAPPAVPGSPGADESTQVLNGETNAMSLPPVSATPAWPLGSKIELHFHLATSPFHRDVFLDRDKTESLPSFIWDNITLGDWSDDSRAMQYMVNIPAAVQTNKTSLFAHIFVVKDNASPDPASPNFNLQSVHHFPKLLTRYMPKVKVRKEKNLLTSEEEASKEEDEPQADVIVPYWHSNLTLTLVSDNPAIPYQKLPPVVSQYISLIPNARDHTGTQGLYSPIIYPNDFWHLRSQLVEVNSTTPTLPLHVTFYPISYMKFQMYATLTSGFDEAAKGGAGAASAELDEVKRMLVETNPFLLILTAVVSILHMVFEMLAFSSDVSHWRNKKELTGVSVRIVTNVLVQFVILLYLLDNNAETSWMILMGQGMGMLIEAWKVTKAVDIKVMPAAKGSKFPYRLDIQDKHVLSDDERKTQEYDKEAFRYVSYVAIPLLAGYTIYSLIYETHRGWYSFVISTLTSFVYLFGFAQLVPQLIINYKLKSVAHMPIKAMIYKTLSTVVDDFFAFCIKMPILHRLACFRDDVVFLVFLYQRWIYRVDPTRVNEFGQVMVPEEDVKDESKKDK
ncbi:cleft lip and palate transmembrane protein 1-domain-containing protein [Gautieria morchelliformis]|nr:cleft lip and palate transmembrane protein 1-domain-containing protein [Gautieria morchelliformis]